MAGKAIHIPGASLVECRAVMRAVARLNPGESGGRQQESKDQNPREDAQPVEQSAAGESDPTSSMT